MCHCAAFLSHLIIHVSPSHLFSLLLWAAAGQGGSVPVDRQLCDDRPARRGALRGPARDTGPSPSINALSYISREHSLLCQTTASQVTLCHTLSPLISPLCGAMYKNAVHVPPVAVVIVRPRTSRLLRGRGRRHGGRRRQGPARRGRRDRARPRRAGCLVKRAQRRVGIRNSQPVLLKLLLFFNRPCQQLSVCLCLSLCLLSTLTCCRRGGGGERERGNRRSLLVSASFIIIAYL